MAYPVPCPFRVDALSLSIAASVCGGCGGEQECARGMFQKSVVVVSRYPYVNLFERLVKVSLHWVGGGRAVVACP